MTGVRWQLALIVAVALVGAMSARPASSGVRVVGGTPIQVQSAPWTVLVYVSAPRVQECTGSVIDASHVVTAAHCVYDGSGTQVQPSSVSIYAGVSNFLSPIATDQEQARWVSSFRVHPAYADTNKNVADDVAVLALAAPLDLSGRAVQAVALASPNTPFPAGASVTTAGFGVQDAAANDASGALVSLAATVDPQGECGDWTQTDFIKFNNGIALCSAAPAGATCHGDSGAGVVTTGGTPVLVGVHYASQTGCPIGGHAVAAYVGAPEILSFIQGNDQPPKAPRPSTQTVSRLTWHEPLVVGDTLTCSTGGWPEPVQVTYSFLSTANRLVLQTGPRGSYLLPPTTAGTQISCTVAVTNGGGTTLVGTNATPGIKPAPQVKIEPLAPLAAKRGHRIALDVVLTGPPGLSGTFSVCATPTASVGGQLCRSAHRPAGAAGPLHVALTLTIKSTAPLGTARVAIRASAGTSHAKTTALIRITKP